MTYVRNLYENGKIPVSKKKTKIKQMQSDICEVVERKITLKH